MRYFTLAILIVCSTWMAQADNKSDRLRPQWMIKQLPNPKSAGYIFVKAEGSGSSLEAARQSCLVELASYLETERGLQINNDFQQHSSMTTTKNYNEHRSSKANMAYYFTQTDNFNMEVIEKGRKINMVCRTIDEYWVKTGGTYFVTTLYTVADQNMYGGSYYDRISTTSRYGAAGLASIIPGAGQFLKGDVAKGVSFLVADVACAAGIILCESTRAAYAAKVKQQPQYALQYSTRANNWATGRNICLGVTAGIWVWNIIDAFAAKGARRVIVKPQRGYFSMTPTSTFDPIHHTHDMGVGMAYHF